ncbi:MAG: lipopolysaccharide transport periplasmic protein LptA [Albidovulum sp.]|uniref:lipopolysaccharide transport periplasmic protein LptA n=1 Tax=Albidovulum sp. TaxID=1872424 RepID=UPI003C9088B6
MLSQFRALMAGLTMAAIVPLAAFGQGTEVSFGGIRADTKQPVEVTADQLDVNQNDGTAIFTGNVIVIQGEMRLTAPRLQVEYGTEDKTEIERLHATGGVTMVSGPEAAEAQEAVYTVAAGEVVLTGDVLLTQAGSTMSGQKLVVDLDTGTGQMEGRVKTILLPGKK